MFMRGGGVDYSQHVSDDIYTKKKQPSNEKVFF
jgi:hypothetical protein